MRSVILVIVLFRLMVDRMMILNIVMDQIRVKLYHLLIVIQI
jgi:hypothetical protein